MHQHDQHGPDAEGAEQHKRDIRGTRAFILGGLSGGHGVFHWYIQSFLVALPHIKAELSLSNVQVGILIAVREFVSGVVNIPGGFLTDIFRRHWGLIMAGCMAFLGLGYVALGWVPNYAVFLVIIAVLGIPPAIWHLPAMVTLSHRFAGQRGMALGAHNVGGGLADAAGPLITGFLLLALTWRNIMVLYGIPAFLLALVVWWAFKPIGAEQSRGPQPSFSSQLHTTVQLARNPLLLGLMAVGGLRGMGHIGFITFLSIYLKDELLMSDPQVGLHIGLITFLGIFSSPILGVLSDRYGRKRVLVPAFILEALLLLSLLGAGSGLLFTLVIALLGLFIFSTQPVIIAATLDVIGEGAQATSLGFLFTSRFLLAVPSPIIAGRLYDAFGVGSTFYYVASLFLCAALIMLILPLRPFVPLAHGQGGQHPH